MDDSDFEWNEDKNAENQKKYGVDFYEAQHAFLNEGRMIAEDVAHSEQEKRYCCFGKNSDGTEILTVRFTYRKRKIYEQSNSIH